MAPYATVSPTRDAAPRLPELARVESIYINVL